MNDPITDNTATHAVFEGNPAVSLRQHYGALHSLVADQPDWVAWSMVNWIGERSAVLSVPEEVRST